MSDSLQPHGLQNSRLPCPSPTPRACSNSYPSSRWCHPTISSSVVPVSSCVQSLPAGPPGKPSLKKFLIKSQFMRNRVYIFWLPDTKNWLTGKDPDAKRDLGQEEKGMREDEMVGWHHRLDGHELEWTPGVGDGQGGLACCNSWGHKRVGHNWVTELKIWKKTVDLIIFPSEKAFRCLYIVTYMPTYCIHKLFLKWYMKNC